MTHADPVGSVDGSSSAVGFGVLEREREDGAADSVTVTVGVGDADAIPDPGSPPVRSAARATINPPMPARAPTISQWMRSRQDFRPFWAGREGPFDPGAEGPIEVTSDLLLMKDPSRRPKGTFRHSVAHVAVGVRHGTTMVYLRWQGPVETDPAAALRTGQAAIMHTLDRLPVGGSPL
ncbi:hypothetical protein ACIHFD_51325 [Nonomuraea sp. NPDC051941]|uniref:hypothetical protein n=1 Tax=Nonomuraea sp. NPDC051941 TaxID=3364373 RepID=UPI0037C6E1F4